MKIHNVKSWSHFFKAIKEGRKKHDLRKDDRDFKIGDTIILHDYDNIKGQHTGDIIEAEVSYITSTRYPCAFSSSALDRDYVILSLDVKQTYPMKQDNESTYDKVLKMVNG